MTVPIDGQNNVLSLQLIMNKNIKEKIKNWHLYVILDKKLANEKSYEEIVNDVIKGGADVIQLRDKSVSKDELIEIGKKLCRLTKQANISFIVNDYPDVAKAIDADGVHIGQGDISFVEAKKIIGSEKIVGISTHNKEQVLEAIKIGADYIGVGPVFQTISKENPDPVVGIDLIKWVSQRCEIPFVAIGGINLNNLDNVLSAGAECIAVISAIMKSDDILKMTKSFKEKIDNLLKLNQNQKTKNKVGIISDTTRKSQEKHHNRRDEKGR